MFANNYTRTCVLSAIGAIAIFCLPRPVVASVNWQTEATTPGATANFEDDTNWDATDYDTVPSVGPELTPPGFDSTWFIEGTADDPDTAGEDETRDGFNGTIFLTEDRDGSDEEHPKLGAGAIGGGYGNEVTRLVIDANVTFTGIERLETGEYNTQVRQLRIGQTDRTPGDQNFPWGIVQQVSGHTFVEMANDPARGDLLLSNDKVDSAGSIWEVGGTASLDVATDVHMGAKGGVRAPGNVFRIRGSDVGPITNGDRFQIRSQTAVWDADEVDLGGGFRHRFNRGKSVLEFVLDDGGVGPITVEDNLDLGANVVITTPNLGETIGIAPAFLRIKLSQPTMVGQGVFNPDDPGAGDVIVLAEGDRLTADGLTSVPVGGEELLDGRFYDPDHTNDTGTSPHRVLLNGFRTKSDYAGAQYSWLINYLNPADDDVISPMVILSELQITGTPGDLNGDTILSDADRTALMSAIAAPPVSNYDLLGNAQNLFDLNADDVIDSLDLATFNTYFLAPSGMAGDFNDDGKVDAADYTVWRNNLNAATDDPINNNGDGVPGVTQNDYGIWKTNFGSGGGGAFASTAVPEPSSFLMALLCVAGVVGLRRRAA